MLNIVWRCHANKQGSKDLGKNKTKQTNTTTPKQQPYTLWKKYSWLWQLNTDDTLPILHIFQIKLVPPTFLFLYSPSQSCTFKWAWLIVGMFHLLRFTCPLLKLRLEKTSGNIWSHLLWKQGLKLGYARQCQTALDISSKGDSTTSLRNLFQRWLVLMTRILFLYPDGISPEQPRPGSSCPVHPCIFIFYTNHRWSTWRLWLDCLQPSLP